ncbi:MAG: EpsI family protein, partial [Planctomycetes bacterium]|nr:EpsI family protein [Planctomycetota bacterium]
GTLAQIPQAIGSWRGEDVPVSDAVIVASQVDDHIYRRYRSAETAGELTLFVGGGARPRDLMPHRPEVCYPSAGWVWQRAIPLTLETPPNGSLACRLIEFQRGGLSSERAVVLNYYLVDGACLADVDELRTKAALGGAAVRQVVQVQISARPATGTDSQIIRRMLEQFAISSFPGIHRATVGEATEPISPSGK